MRHDWDTGLMIGGMIAEQRNLIRRVGTVETGQEEIRREMAKLRAYMIRGGFLLLLGLVAAGTNLSAEKAGEFTGTTLKSLMK